MSLVTKLNAEMAKNVSGTMKVNVIGAIVRIKSTKFVRMIIQYVIIIKFHHVISAEKTHVSIVGVSVNNVRRKFVALVGANVLVARIGFVMPI